jgi:hypothetical protein
MFANTKKEIQIMIRLPKSAVSFGAVALVACAATLAVPRAAHAVAAALVQVTNTTANPAVTQTVPTQASQLIQLSPGFFDPLVAGQLENFTTVPVGAINSPGEYSIPAGQSLVITAVDFLPVTTCTGTSSINLSSGGNSSLTWVLSNSTSTHFEYPSGMVFGPGSLLKDNWNPSNLPSCDLNAQVVNLFGYLTYI